jgi:hypothetical protein
VGVPHASVLIDPEPLSTSDGTSGALRDQNQTLMNFVVRSIAYLQNGYTISHSSYGEGRRERSSVHAPSTAVVIERRAIVVGGGSLHATSGVAVCECVAVRSGGVAARAGKKMRV